MGVAVLAALPVLVWAGAAHNATGRKGDALAVCGRDERSPVACLKSSHPEEFKRNFAVARLKTYHGHDCTAWRLWPGNLMMTNNHCIGTQQDLNNFRELVFFDQTSYCPQNGLNTPGDMETVKVRGDKLLRTSVSLDYTLFTLNEYSLPLLDKQRLPDGAIRYLSIEAQVQEEGAPVYLIHHGDGFAKQISITDDTNTADGKCKLEESPDGTNWWGYRCDTEGGSSGAPVLLRDSHKVVGLHAHGTRGCSAPNGAVSMTAIWPEIAEFIPDATPAPPSANAPAAVWAAVAAGVGVLITAAVLVYFYCRPSVAAPCQSTMNEPDVDAEAGKSAAPHCDETCSPYGTTKEDSAVGVPVIVVASAD